MNVAMVGMFDLPASETIVATVDGGTISPDGLQAVDRFRQSSSQGFQLAEFISREQVGVSHPPPGQRALQQLDPAVLVWKIFKSHRPITLIRRSGDFNATTALEKGRAARAIEQS
jgi:hypothetical protein